MMYNMPMQRNRTAVLLTALMIVTAGCTTAPAPSTEPAVPENEPVQTEDASVSDAYASYHALMEKAGVEGNYTAGVQRTYEMRYEDGSLGTYDLDGVIAEDDDCIHLTQHIYSDGIQADIEGWYDDSRLYMTYNTVDYYEDMDRNAVRDVMLVKLEPYEPKESDLASVESKTQGTDTVYTLNLKPEKAKALFSGRYDIYGLNTYENYDVQSGIITQTFDESGRLTGEETAFQCSVTSNGSPVKISAMTNLGYLNIGETDVSITPEQKQAFAAFVNYQDIDTDAISDADITSDDPEDTAEATFRKRLVNRLGYQLQEDGTYLAEFNETESYRVDFEHSLFTYSNRTSHYVYNWKGDQGGFEDSCSIDFRKGTRTSSCEDSTAEQIEAVRKYFAMELYYCGLSLDDLAGEASQSTAS